MWQLCESHNIMDLSLFIHVFACLTHTFNGFLELDDSTTGEHEGGKSGTLPSG